jgi:hypothetical protein
MASRPRIAIYPNTDKPFDARLRAEFQLDWNLLFQGRVRTFSLTANETVDGHQLLFTIFSRSANGTEAGARV